HTHIDHIQGLPLFSPLYKPGYDIHVWAGHLLPGGTLENALARLMSSPLFPLTLAEVKSNLKLHDFSAGETLRVPNWQEAGLRVHTLPLTHPDGATGYRIEHGNKSVCYITDYEHTDAAQHARLAEFVHGTDYLIYDATYCDENYASHKGWGHSTWQVATRLADSARVGRLILFHHDPGATDAQLMARQEQAELARHGTLLAREGLCIHVRSGQVSQPQAEADSLKLVERLTDIGVALSSQSDLDHLLETILIEAQSISGADGGTLYLRNERDELEFSIVRNHSLGLAYGGSTGVAPPIAALPLHDPVTKVPNYSALAAFSVLLAKPVAIEDVYNADGFDFEGAKVFDRQNNYRTQSVLAIPMINHKKEVLGCLQLINARDAESGGIIPFSPRMQRLILSLASQAAITLDNKMLIMGQKTLLESFIRMIAQAIDAKSPYTGAHCERVPTLTNMLAHAACEASEGPFKNFTMTEDEKYELHIAGWMHDCGKVATPVHIMDKSTKLEKIYDRIALVEARFEVWKRDARIA
ncbi:MAG: GAF domain-containing protein, partial [Proteobacteria bacterium]|nr:GAF domain-containing protein [Pseudomonadota bacterium]